MRKEVLLAIIAGGALGLVIAFGVWRINSNFKTKDGETATQQTSLPSPTPTTQATAGDFKIVLARPDNLSVFTQTPATVTGATKQGAYVVISGESGDNIVNASDSGAFSGDIDLLGGINRVLVSAYDASGSQVDVNLDLVYSSQFTPPAKGATAYVGTVTDITNSVIQIKSANGDIQQIAGASDTTYVDLRNSDTKIIKASDVAIGDFLVGMGGKGTNNILNASRILITDPVSTTRKNFYGVVTDDSGINKFVAKNPKTNEEITVAAGKGVSVTGVETSFGKISNNEKVIVAGNFKDGTLTARTIAVLK